MVLKALISSQSGGPSFGPRHVIDGTDILKATSIYTVHGDWVHIAEAHRTEMRPGSFEFSPAGEFHTAETANGPADVIFVYLGGSSLDAVGYERRGDLE